MTQSFSARLLLLPLILSLPACGLETIGAAPRVSAPGTIEAIPPTATDAPTVDAAARSVAGEREPPQAGSLWRPGSRTFFRDNRARKVGDLVTVDLEIDDSAQLENRTQLDREGKQGLRLPAILGGQTGVIARALESVTGAGGMANTLDVTSNSNANGQAQLRRGERIRLQMAATVVAILPNGNLEIAGNQEIRVSEELRSLQVRGIVRPEDILPNNRISSDKIADARVIYGGRGVATDIQRPRWGQQAIDKITPW